MIKNNCKACGGSGQVENPQHTVWNQRVYNREFKGKVELVTAFNEYWGSLGCIKRHGAMLTTEPIIKCMECTKNKEVKPNQVK